MFHDDGHLIQKYRAQYDYHLHNSTLNAVNHCKHFRVIHQYDLRWSKHIEEITAKAETSKAPKLVREKLYQDLRWNMLFLPGLVVVLHAYKFDNIHRACIYIY